MAIGRRNDDDKQKSDQHDNRFACRGSDDRLTFYRAEIVPWLWFLTRTANCRIFQTQTVVDIIKAVFGDSGFTDFETSAIQGASDEPSMKQTRLSSANRAASGPPT